MDLSSAISSAGNSNLRYQVGIEVQKESQDAARQQGEAALELLDAAASIAQSAPPTTGRNRIDTYA